MLAVAISSCNVVNRNSTMDVTAAHHKDVQATVPDSSAVQRVKYFLHWYSKTIAQAAQISLYTCGSAANPKTYRVNPAGKEQYISLLQSSGQLSEIYLDSMHRYFKKVDDWLIERPSSEGPCEGLDFDLVTGGQDYENGFAPDRSEITRFTANNNNADVTIKWHDGRVQQYHLSQKNGQWWIDHIANL